MTTTYTQDLVGHWTLCSLLPRAFHRPHTTITILSCSVIMSIFQGSLHTQIDITECIRKRVKNSSISPNMCVSHIVLMNIMFSRMNTYFGIKTTTLPLLDCPQQDPVLINALYGPSSSPIRVLHHNASFTNWKPPNSRDIEVISFVSQDASFVRLNAIFF